jgi:hypothetical protein
VNGSRSGFDSLTTFKLLKPNIMNTVQTVIKERHGELIGYRLKNEADRDMVDKAVFGSTSRWIPRRERVSEDAYPFEDVPKNRMSKWDSGLYFIRGHIAGCLVLRARESGLLDKYFEPVYEKS